MKKSRHLPTQDPKGSFITYLSIFLRSAVQPSLAALAIAFSTVLLVGGLYLFLLTEHFMSGPGYRFLMVSDFDTQAYATHRALSIEDVDKPIVVVLGNSLMVHCVHSERELEEAMSETLSQRPQAFNLSTNAQSTWEMAGLTDHLPKGGRGVVVIGLSSGILTREIDDPSFSSHANDFRNPKLGLTSPVIDEEARQAGLRVPLRTGIYSIDNSKFLIGRRYHMIKNILMGRGKYSNPLLNAAIDMSNDPKLLQAQKEALKNHEKHFDNSFGYNLSVLSRMIERVRSRGDYQFVITEPPVNPAWNDEPAGAEMIAKYHNVIKGFAAEEKLEFVSLNQAANLQRSDFIDFEGHIGNTSAQRACTTAVGHAAAETFLRSSRDF